MMTLRTTFNKPWRGLTAFLCGAALAVSLFMPMRACATGHDAVAWQVSQLAAAPDATSRVLWVAANDVVSIWKLDSAGNVSVKSAVYGPYTGGTGEWQPFGIVVGSDGSTSLLWTNSGANGVQLSIWRFDSNLNHVATGPVYGPYANGNAQWSPDQFVAGPNGTTRLLWSYGVGQAGAAHAEPRLSGVKTDSSPPPAPPLDAGAEVSIWAFDQNGKATSVGPTYGPYSDSTGEWQVTQFQSAPNGTSRLMWIHRDTSTAVWQTEVSFWTLNSSGAESHAGTVYGPYADWSPVNFDINPSDSTLRLLWSKGSGAPVYSQVMSAWSLGTQGTAVSMGPSYGPYSGWSPTQIYANSNGTSAIAWTDTSSGTYYSPLSFWTLTSAGAQTGSSPSYGPYNGWNPREIVRNPATGDFRILWLESGSEIMSQWSLNPAGGAPTMGPSYGPYGYVAN